MNPERQIVITIFGITGDWAYKKVIPALWYLWKKEKIDKSFVVFGFGRRSLNKQELSRVVERAVERYAKYSNLSLSIEEIERFVSKFSYIQNDFNKLKDLIPKKSNKIFYCATPPNSLEYIFSCLKKTSLSKETKKYWSRIVIEKPFGEDEKSANKLISILKENFKVSQVYPIDHYLFKESVQKMKNIHNDELKNVARVDITTNEVDGVEQRGKFYDSVGALRDVGQNHLLMLAAVLFSGRFRSRQQVLQSVGKWNKESLQTNTYKAQHVGYVDIKDVDPNSKTETFFTVKTDINFSKGIRVPIYLQAGKRLEKEIKEIVISYKKGIRSRIIKLNNKTKYVGEYSKAFQDIINGKKKYFVTYGEILACWKFTDPIVSFWKKNNTTINKYRPGTIPDISKHLVF